MIDTEARPLHVPLVRHGVGTVSTTSFHFEARLVSERIPTSKRALLFRLTFRKDRPRKARRTVNPDHGVKVTGAVSNAKSVGVPGRCGRPASAASIPGTVTTPSAISGSDYIIGLESAGPISGCVRAKGVAIMRSEYAIPAACGGRDLGTNSEEVEPVAIQRCRTSSVVQRTISVLQCYPRRDVGSLTRTAKRRTSPKGPARLVKMGTETVKSERLYAGPRLARGRLKTGGLYSVNN